MGEERRKERREVELVQKWEEKRRKERVTNDDEL